jgi:hypothetical protein
LKRIKVEGFKGSRVQGFKGSRVQGFKGSRVQGFKGSRENYNQNRYINNKFLVLFHAAE